MYYMLYNCQTMVDSVDSPELTGFDATLVAQEFFDGSKTPEQWRAGGWHMGDYRIASPNEIWHVEGVWDNKLYARREDRLLRFLDGVAYALAANGVVAPETVTPATVSAVWAELERIICINLHNEGPEAGAAEHERVQESREACAARRRRIELGERVLLSIFDRGPIDYRKTSFA